MNEVELDLEDMGVTLDPVEWYRTIVDGKVTANSPPNSFVPDGVVNYLGPVFKGFMVSPCAVVQYLKTNHSLQKQRLPKT